MDIKLTNAAKTVLQKLNNNGFEAYVVGGCVRDQLMGKAPYDFDVTTNAPCDSMLKLFGNYGLITKGTTHGTVGIIIDGEVVEATTYRIDGDYTDFRHPQKVSFVSSLKSDLGRRDFTVNALAYSENTGIIDLFDGIGDIKRKTIKAIGNPDIRFEEDALRILRALRFSSALSFNVEEKTAESIHKNYGLLGKISKERITAEFSGILKGENAPQVINTFKDVISFILPQSVITQESISKLSSSPVDFETRMYIILGGNDFTDENSLLRISNMSACEIMQMQKMETPQNKSDLKNMLRQYSMSAVEKFTEISESPYVKEYLREIAENGECYSLSSLQINGNDLYALGLRGKEIGNVLNTLLDEVIAEKLENTKEALFTRVESIFKQY